MRWDNSSRTPLDYMTFTAMSLSGFRFGWEQAYFGRFQKTPAIDPIDPAHATSRRLLRGGDWNYPACGCLASSRDALAPTVRSETIGFRVSLAVNGVKSTTAQHVLKPEGEIGQ